MTCSRHFPPGLVFEAYQGRRGSIGLAENRAAPTRCATVVDASRVRARMITVFREVPPH